MAVLPYETLDEPTRVGEIIPRILHEAMILEEGAGEATSRVGDFLLFLAGEIDRPLTTKLMDPYECRILVSAFDVFIDLGLEVPEGSSPQDLLIGYDIAKQWDQLNN